MPEGHHTAGMWPYIFTLTDFKDAYLNLELVGSIWTEHLFF